MAKVKLDSINLQILKALQEDGRISNVDLSRRVGISAPPCLRRVRALSEAGYIEGYHADLNDEALGYGVTVGLHSQAEVDLKSFEARAESWSVVRECFMLAGEIDYILKIVARDWDEYQNFLTTQLTAAPNVAHVKTCLTVRNSKHLPGIPLE